MDDYEPWLTPCDPDFDPEKCESAYALWAVKEEGEPVKFLEASITDNLDYPSGYWFFWRTISFSEETGRLIEGEWGGAGDICRADLFRRPPGPADASARARRPYGHLGPPRRGGHVRGGKRPVGEQFELGVRPMAISRGVNHRSPHPRVAKSRDSYPLGARLFQRFPSGKRFSIGSRHGGLPVRETPWCRPSGAGSIVGEAPIRHLPPGADLYG